MWFHCKVRWVDDAVAMMCSIRFFYALAMM
jgi:hypothetical protein